MTTNSCGISGGDVNVSNGKHVRSHSLRSFPAVAAAVMDGGKRPRDDRSSQVAVSDPQTINSSNHPAAKMTSTWKQVSIFKQNFITNTYVPYP